MSWNDIGIRNGACEQHRAAAARLYLHALHEKFAPFLGRDSRAERFLRENLCPDRLIVACRSEELLGVAGFKHDGRGAIAPSLASALQIFGWSGAHRLLGMSLLERSEEQATLLMDGLAVVEHARGRKIGTRLLQAIENHARALGKERIRLDVIDTNVRARLLYERQGFRAVRTRSLGVFGFLFSFNAATEMHKDIRN